MTTSEPLQACAEPPLKQDHGLLLDGLTSTLRLDVGLAQVLGGGTPPSREATIAATTVSLARTMEPHQDSQTSLVSDLAAAMNVSDGLARIIRAEGGHASLIQDIASTLDAGRGLTAVFDSVATPVERPSGAAARIQHNIATDGATAFGVQGGDITIAKTPGTDLAELEEISAGMQDYIRAANTESRQAAFDAMSRRGVMQRLFPSQYERERQRVSVQAPRQLSESKSELLEVFTRTQIEIARKRADALIAAQGMHLQAQLARFANEKIHDLNSTVDASRERFLTEMDRQFVMIEGFQHRPELHKAAYASLLHQIDVYFGSTAALLDGFIQSLRNKVGEAQR